MKLYKHEYATVVYSRPHDIRPTPHVIAAYRDAQEAGEMAAVLVRRSGGPWRIHAVVAGGQTILHSTGDVWHEAPDEKKGG